MLDISIFLIIRNLSPAFSTIKYQRNVFLLNKNKLFIKAFNVWKMEKKFMT